MNSSPPPQAPGQESIYRANSSSVQGERICVVHLLHTMAYGGIETIVINSLLHVDRERFDMKVICFANPGGTERHFIEVANRNGIDVATIPWGRSKPFWSASRRLAKYLAQHNAQILHTHNVYADVVGWLAARKAACRTVASLYVWGEFGLKRNLLQWMDTQVLRWFGHVTCQCEKTRLDTVARGIPAEKVSVLSSGLEATVPQLTAHQREEGRAVWGAQPEHRVLVNVARLYPEKAQQFLLDAFVKIHAERPDTRLWIAGVGPLESELRAYCTSLGLDPFVRWLGFCDDLPRLFELSDIQVHPSLNEGVPLALLHGMAAGMPIVATAVGGVPEVLRDGRSGLLVPVADQTAFVAATLRLLDNPQEARGLGQGAQAFITQEYSQTQSAAELERLYRQLVNRPVATR